MRSAARLLAILTLVVMTVASTACNGIGACLSSPSPDDPFLIGGVVRIKRGATTVGFVTTGIAGDNHMWFLINDDENVPLEHSSLNPEITFAHESPTPISWSDLCANYSSELTNPRVVKLYVYKQGEWTCP